MFLPRAIPPSSIAGGADPGTNNPSSTSHTHNISTGSAIAIAVCMSLALLGIVIVAFYFLYWRNRTPKDGNNTSPRSRFSTPAVKEFEIDEDGMKIEIQREPKRKTTWWGRNKGSVQRANTLVHDRTVSPPPTVAARSEE